MRILILSDEVWNDEINGNNVLSSWFEGMDAEFANIYASPGNPLNQCCNRYFQITDQMMLKSIVNGKKAGKTLPLMDYTTRKTESIGEKEPKKLYTFLKSISGPFLRLIRETLWILGKYDTDELGKFIHEFEPDIIFTERMASCKMLRLENVVKKVASVPMYAFTGDDEYTLKQLSFSPFFWINRFMVRRMLRKNVKDYQIYYTLSEEQGVYYEEIFGCKCKLLCKCGEFKEKIQPKKVHKPIRMIYAGKFYCNRWKMLGQIADAIREVNKDEVKIILEIYTKDIATKEQEALLNDGRNSFIRGAVNQKVLSEKYKEADIAIHVESLDLKNRLATRYSFSTKIIDCIFSGCAILAYCWNQHSGWTYLKKHDAAICVGNQVEMNDAIKRICSDTEIISEYSIKACECGVHYHDRQKIQEMLLKDMNSKYYK